MSRLSRSVSLINRLSGKRVSVLKESRFLFFTLIVKDFRVTLCIPSFVNNFLN